MNVFHLHLGAQVRCLDGLCGKLSHIILNPITKKVTGLIVTEGFLKPKARIFPLSTVIYTTPDEIHLSLCLEDLPNHGEYREKTFVRLLANSHGRLELLDKNTLVENSDGLIGRLSQLNIHPQTHQIKLLKVQQGFLFPEYLNVPASFVQSIKHHTICLSLPYQALDNFKRQPQQYAW